LAMRIIGLLHFTEKTEILFYLFLIEVGRGEEDYRI